MSKHYQREVHRGTGYHATWLPNVRLEVGQIGVMSAHGFDHRTNATEKLGLQVALRRKPAFKTTLNLMSGDGVSLEVNVGEAGRKVSVGFGKNNSYLIQLAGCEAVQGLDLEKLADAMRDAWIDQLWEEELVVITEVVSARTGSVLVSASSGAALNLDLAGPGDAAVPVLADFAANMTVTRQSGSITSVLGERGLTPLFKAMRLQRRWWGQPRPVEVRGSLEPALSSAGEWLEPWAQLDDQEA